jgi:hypothetical protein
LIILISVSFYAFKIKLRVRTVAVETKCSFTRSNIIGPVGSVGRACDS